MAYADIDICNLALSHLGDIATVASIAAPTTPQERYCAKFYPLARDITLEKHLWAFATVRAALAASVTAPPSTWAYAYSAPADVVNYIAVLDPNAADDQSAMMQFFYPGPLVAPVSNLGAYTPQPFTVEQDGSGGAIIYTNQQDAVLRYTKTVTDPSKWPTTFIEALSYRLAAMLAGPIIKGDEGRKVAQSMQQLAEVKQIEAEGSNANSGDVRSVPGAAWIVNR
jgi:hypothetical protein